MSDTSTPELSKESTIYSRIQPDLSKFTIEELEKALKELDRL